MWKHWWWYRSWWQFRGQWPLALASIFARNLERNIWPDKEPLLSTQNHLYCVPWFHLLRQQGGQFVLSGVTTPRLSIGECIGVVYHYTAWVHPWQRRNHAFPTTSCVAFLTGNQPPKESWITSCLRYKLQICFGRDPLRVPRSDSINFWFSIRNSPVHSVHVHLIGLSISSKTHPTPHASPHYTIALLFSLQVFAWMHWPACFQDTLWARRISSG